MSNLVVAVRLTNVRGINPRIIRRIEMTQPVAPGGANAWILGTRKGAWAMKSDGRQRLDEPWFFGHQVHHVVQDVRGTGTFLAAVRTGHLGPTIFRSQDSGRTWKESAQPPKFRTKEEYANSA